MGKDLGTVFEKMEIYKAILVCIKRDITWQGVAGLYKDVTWIENCLEDRYLGKDVKAAVSNQITHHN